MSSISFAEIIHGRASSVRVTDDGLIYAVDLVMVVTSLERDQAGLALRRVSSKNLLSIKMIERNTGGKGNARTQLINLQDALQLIMVLPGEMAKTIRAQIGDVMTKFFAGDESLVGQIRANAQSDAPIAQMARASLAAERASEPVVDSHVLMHKRRLETLEIETLEYELSSKKQHADLDLTIKRRGAELEYAEKITTNYRALCQDTSMDSRAALILKDYYLNMIILPPVAAPNRLTDGTEQQPAPPPVSSRPISLSQVATELGLKIPTGELISLGGKLRKEYESKHGHPPGKHDQLCSGRMTKVNSYCESDRPLVVEVLREWSPAQ